MFRVGRKGADLGRVLPDVLPGHYYHTPSEGAFALHEMIAYLVHRTGPCDMWLTSYGVSAGPLSKVFDMRRDGRLRSLRLFFDSRVPRECPEAHQLCLSPPPDTIIRFGQNHSKLVVLKRGSMDIMMQTSANLTNNPRLEAYVISTVPQAASFTSRFINELMGTDED